MKREQNGISFVNLNGCMNISILVFVARFFIVFCLFVFLFCESFIFICDNDNDSDSDEDNISAYFAIPISIHE